jgi:hypothetical protein
MFVGETEGVWQVTRKVIVQMYDKESVHPGPVGTVTLGVHTAHNFCPFLFHLSYYTCYIDLDRSSFSHFPAASFSLFHVPLVIIYFDL